MAIRKPTMLEQVAEAVKRVKPSERPLVTVHAISGPTPWLMVVLPSELDFFQKSYFITVTERSLLFHKAGYLTGRPKKLLFEVGRAETAALVSEVRQRRLWDSFRFHKPRAAKPTTIYVEKHWRGELDQLLAALTDAPAEDRLRLPRGRGRAG